MTLFLYLFAIIATSQALTDKDEWINFKAKHGKIYKSSIEEIQRFSIFQSNLRRIESHNTKEEQGFSSFRMGVTKFADLTRHEFKDMMKLSKRQKPKSYGSIRKFDDTRDIPAEVDWSKKGAVTEIKDQGQCGSCWSFSATGTIEGANFIKTGKLISLSEQNLVDCDSDCYGCGGGYMIDALKYVQKNGIMAEDKYPYKAEDEKCRFNSSEVAVKISSFTQIKSGDENDLQQKVALVGPVSVAIDASWNFQLYSSGVLDDDSCENSEESLDHGVLAVGYGTKHGQDYWIVKNSWGEDWGIKGYVWMSRNKNNQCGIATDAVIAIA
ncbi:unnamed protein product [Psylliodes chrysocephalus]|uniref:Uncharacterized protein n=1 Tax=Psylliodes chrysocephalus TaxID=3402493 RepID=A0A9P0G7B6_9CUCU|nr:unnamed protein product [Psylliodes chrysocephala]